MEPAEQRPPLDAPPPSAHRSGERAEVSLHQRTPFAPGEGSTLQAIAESMGLDDEAAMDALLRAAAEGYVETNLSRWRPRERVEEGEA